MKKRQCGDLQLLVSENIIINMKVEEKAIGVELVFHQENLHFRSILHCDDSENKLLSQLGKIKMGQGSCIYFKKLADLNLNVLDKLITDSLHQTKKLYG